MTVEKMLADPDTMSVRERLIFVFSEILMVTL